LLVRRWVQQVREGRPENFRVDEDDADFGRLLDATFAGLNRNKRAWIAALVLSQSPKQATDLATWGQLDIPAATREAQTAGWMDESELTVPSESHAAAVFRAIKRDETLHPLVQRAIHPLSESSPRRAEAHPGAGTAGKKLHVFSGRRARRGRSGSIGGGGAVRDAAARDVDPTAWNGCRAHRLGHGFGGMWAVRTTALAFWNIPPREGIDGGQDQLAERRAWLLGSGAGDPVGRPGMYSRPR